MNFAPEYCQHKGWCWVVNNCKCKAEKPMKEEIKPKSAATDFPEFVESTGLSQKDKDLIKGVFYDWKGGNT